MATLARSAHRYLFFAPLTQAHFFLPVFFLYFSQHMPLDQVLRLEAIYYIAVVLLEVPSGYFSDTVGRRITLLIASAATLVAYALFSFGNSFIVFTLAQIGLATGMAFRSGTDTAYHYDVLKSLDRQREYDDREALISRNTFFVTAGAALIGGLVSIYDLRAAYVLSFIGACIVFGIALTFIDPDRTRIHTRFLLQMRDCLSYLQHPTLAWFMLFFIFMTIINHMPYEFYQPYIQILTGKHTTPAPALTGLHTALTMGIAAYFAKRSIRLRNRVGIRAALLSAAGLQTLLILFMSLLLHPTIALLLTLRTVPRALMTAPLNAAIVPRLHQQHRATYLSIQSLLGRLAFSASLLLLASATGNTTDWLTLSHTLHLCALFAIAGILILILLAFLIPRTRWQLTSES